MIQGFERTYIHLEEKWPMSVKWPCFLKDKGILG